MIKIKYKIMENVVVLKAKQGSYDELIKINITGMKGLGGFTIQETIHYLLNTLNSGYVAYNFKSVEESRIFIDSLREEIYRINEKEKGLKELKEEDFIPLYYKI